MSIIINSIFENFHNSGNGSIFCQNGGFLSIICCLFQDSSVDQYGGCFYLKYINFNLSKSNFYRTYSTAKTNDIWGNVFYIINCVSILNDFSISLCGTSDCYSDSSIRFESSKVQIQYYNSSSNYGEGGASGFSIYKASSNPNVSYSTIYEIMDSFAFESTLSYTIITKVNFVKFNKNINQAVYWTNSDNTAKFVMCTFIDLDDISIPINNYIYEAIDCESNGHYDLIDQKESISFIEFYINTNCNNNSFDIIKTCIFHNKIISYNTLILIAITIK